MLHEPFEELLMAGKRFLTAFHPADRLFENLDGAIAVWSLQLLERNITDVGGVRRSLWKLKRTSLQYLHPG